MHVPTVSNIVIKTRSPEKVSEQNVTQYRKVVSDDVPRSTNTNREHCLKNVKLRNIITKNFLSVKDTVSSRLRHG